MAAFAAANLRGGDLVFVCGTTTLVCLLADGDEIAAESVRERLLTFHATSNSKRKNVSNCVRFARRSCVRLSDGKTLAELLSSADGIFATIDSSFDFPKTAKRKHG